MLWLGSLHLQQGPFQASEVIFPCLDLRLTLLQSLLGVSSKFTSTPDAEGALYTYPFVIKEVQQSPEHVDPIFHPSNASQNPGEHSVGEEYMLQVEDMANWGPNEKGRQGLDLGDAHINQDIRSGIWRRERKKKKQLHFTGNFTLDGTVPNPTSSVPKEPSSVLPPTSTASTYHRSGHRYLARRQIRKKVKVLDNRRTFLKKEWKTDDNGWGQPSELEILRAEGIEVSHTSMTWAEQSLIDCKKTPWYRCYRSSMLRWSWTMAEQGEECVEKGDDEGQSEMEIKG
jgi:hypothetical protein